QGARSFHLICEALRVLPRNQPVELAGHHENRTGDVLRNAIERERLRVALRLLMCGAMAANAERLARQLRQGVPISLPVIRTTQRKAGLDAFLERRGARRIVTAEAHAPQSDAGSIEIAPHLDV